MVGLEPTISCSRSMRNTKLSYIPIYKKLVRLAGIEPAISGLRGQHFPDVVSIAFTRHMAASDGFEPPTFSFVAKCSVQLSYEANEET